MKSFYNLFSDMMFHWTYPARAWSLKLVTDDAPTSGSAFLTSLKSGSYHAIVIEDGAEAAGESSYS